jgi:O-acetyl-ADP-ribose deacetylase (regulator of RNase III)
VIKQVHGNLLGADVDALVNTVNTVGVMGKGIALQFKNAYPSNFKAYRDACKRAEVRVGQMFVFDAGQLVRPRWIINFPTKQHWKSRSRLKDIDAGLDNLRDVLVDLNIRSVAVPPLGCGNGGLDWSDVLPMIDSRLGDLDVDVFVYPPDGAPHAAEMRNRTPRPELTPGKAALVAMLSHYAGPAMGATIVEVQKLMYFLQEAGQPLRLHYQRALYGPYADNLRHVLNAVENHYLRGYGDGSQKVWEAEPIEVLPGAEAEAMKALADEPDIEVRMERVLDLVSGFESAYGLELLATVHWVARELGAQADDAALRSGVIEWSPRKQDLFTTPHIDSAIRRLRQERWIVEPVGSDS